MNSKFSGLVISKDCATQYHENFGPPGEDSHCPQVGREALGQKEWVRVPPAPRSDTAKIVG